MTYHILVPQGARGTLVLDPILQGRGVDGAALASRKTEQRALARAGTPHGDVPVRARVSRPDKT